jgi:hypothetical protein
MNVEIGTEEAPIFLFWEYLLQIFGIFSLQCMTHNGCGSDTHTLLLGDERDAGLGELNAEEGGGQAATVKLGVLVHRQGHEEPAAVRPGQLQRQAVLLTQILTGGFSIFS